MTARAPQATKTVVLHIGMHKTGTTSIQNSLKNYDDGQNRYARLAKSPNHSIALITAFSATPEQFHHHTKRGISAETVAAERTRLRDQLEAELNRPVQTLVLSGEGVTRLRRPELEDLRRVLEASGRQIRVIAYLRDPVGFAISSFQQVVKAGSRATFEFHQPQYKRRFAKFIRTFGPLEFVPFTPAAFRNGCIITDFCDRTGLDITRVDKKRANESLSAEAVALLLEWNRDGMKSQGSEAHMAARGVLISELRTQFPGKLRLHPDLVLDMQDAEDCAWIEQRAGFSLAPHTPPPAEASDVITSEAMLRALPQTTLPGLRKLLAAHRLPQGGDSSVALMNRLYQGILDGKGQSKRLFRSLLKR